MSSWSLGDDKDEKYDDRREYRGGDRPAQIEPAFCDWLVQKIADSRTKRTG